MIDVGKTWSFNEIDIIVEKDSQNYPKVRMAIQDILDASGTYAYYGGTTAYYRDLQAILLSGYEELMPLIGNGYHELISDQGTEGNYLISKCNPTRLQALNMPNPVYRLALDLIKYPVIPPPPWPRIYVGTAYTGVFYTTNFSGPLGTQCTWATVNDGLPSLAIHQLQIDHVSGETCQYVKITNAGNTEVWRRYQDANWAVSLDNSVLRTLLSRPGSSFSIKTIHVDRTGSAGNIYVYVIDDTLSQDVFVRSTNYGQSWILICTLSAGDTTNNFVARNNGLWIWYAKQSGSSMRCYVTVDGGTVWNRSDRFHISVYGVPIVINPLQDDRIYGRRNYSNPTWVCTIDINHVKTDLPGPWVRVQDDESSVWFSTISVNNQSVLRDHGIYVTDNAWSVDTDVFTSLPYDNLYRTAQWVSDDTDNYVIIGSNELGGAGNTKIAIWATFADDLAGSFTARAGPNPTTPPYTDSIPETAGSVCRNGIQVVK